MTNGSHGSLRFQQVLVVLPRRRGPFRARWCVTGLPEFHFWSFMPRTTGEDHEQERLPSGVSASGRRAGRSGAQRGTLAAELGISEQNIYTWLRQARIDRGLEAGLGTVKQAELPVARKRIRELEAELLVHRRATELLRGTTDPKVDTRPSK